jgi:CotH kinase protein/Lamin Tail Domain
MRIRKIALWLGLVVLTVAPIARGAEGKIIVNEIFYNAPGELDRLQWIELHNTGDGAADLAGWTLNGGNLYTFAEGTTIDPSGYLVIALDPDEFAKAYRARAIGPLKRALKRGGEKIELSNPQKKVVDSVKYKDRSPWPASADGESASLERICPAVSGESAENWSASPLPADAPRPAGTPGKVNSCYSEVLPPVISVGTAITEAAPGEPLRVQADVKDARGVREVLLLYRSLTVDADSGEAAMAMTRAEGDRFVREIPGHPAGTLVRYRIKAINRDGAVRYYPGENDLRPTLSAYVHDKWPTAKIPQALLILSDRDRLKALAATGGGSGGARAAGPVDRPPAGPRAQPEGSGTRIEGGRRPPRFVGGYGQSEVRAPRGGSALIYADSATGKSSVFDYIHAVGRGGWRGYKLFFPRDQSLNGMSSVSIIFEGSEWSLMAEALAYDLYRRAGNPAPLADFVRLSVDGKVMGYDLMIERPNRSMLRRNRIDDTGNLYKLNWMGRDPVSTHEKKTHLNTGHDDLLAVIGQLQKGRGNPEGQWDVIRQNFDVDEVATYFAVNMVLSHWDGYFNNYYTYHDPKRNKWMMFPWDQDKTWGYYDSLGDDGVFVDMPLTFGMDGDRPPGQGGGGRNGGVFGGLFGGGGGNGFGGGPGAPWWRQPGYFSGPLLANPQFRKVFLARTKDILEKVYTPQIYEPLIDSMVERLREDAGMRAKARRERPEEGVRLLMHNADLLKTHLVKRREFLLAQKELKTLGQEPAEEPQPEATRKRAD